MKKLRQGQYELFTTKADAIDKFMQLQGPCREVIGGEDAIWFYCRKNGRIVISDPPQSRAENDNSTELFAEITEQDGKTYVTYYTAFSKANNVVKFIWFAVYMLLAAVSVVLAVTGAYPVKYLPVVALPLLFFGAKLFLVAKEEKNAPNDSDILINELGRRVEAVNLWDK